MKKEDLIKLNEDLGVEVNPEATVQEIKENVKFVDALLKKQKGLESEIEELKKEVTELHEESEVVAVSGVETVKCGGKHFQITVKSFSHQGKKYSSDDLKENQSLQKELIEGGSGILVELKSE